MDFDLKGKVCLVTGSAAGIGLCTVKELLLNGAHGVTIADIDEEGGQKAINQFATEFGSNKVIFVKTDVTKVPELEDAFKATINKWKTLDVVINNAGHMNEAKWESEIAVNCTGVVRGSLLAMDYMSKDKGGKGGVVVNISSVGGLDPFAFAPVYIGTKHFVQGFSRSLGLPYHFQRTEVRVLTLCPGIANTNLLPSSVEHPFRDSLDTSKQMQAVINRLVLQRPENVAEAVTTIIKKGESGSVWMVEDNQSVVQIKIPERHALETC